jgi:acetolactate synthase I/III small subunit
MSTAPENIAEHIAGHINRLASAESSGNENRRSGEEKGKMLHTFVVYVENKPGVLSRVVSLFRRRAFNIDSLTVGRTEKPDVSRMTIVSEADEDQARRIVANVYKLVNVLLVDDVTGHPALLRDLALMKVCAPAETRSQILELAEVFRARVLDIASESITLELTGGEEKVDRLLELLNPFGLLEVVRTGVVAMRRGAKSPIVTSKASRIAAVDDDSVSYSV